MIILVFFSIYSLALIIDQLPHEVKSISTDDGELEIRLEDIKEFCLKYLYRADLYVMEKSRSIRLGEKLFESTIADYQTKYGYLHGKESYLLGWTDNYRVLKMAKKLGGYEIDRTKFNNWSQK